MGKSSFDGLDLSAVPPAARVKGSRAAVMSLYEVLNRIKLPPLEQIPDADTLAPPAAGAPAKWVISNTEIALIRASTGHRRAPAARSLPSPSDR